MPRGVRHTPFSLSLLMILTSGLVSTSPFGKMASLAPLSDCARGQCLDGQTQKLQTQKVPQRQRRSHARFKPATAAHPSCTYLLGVSHGVNRRAVLSPQLSGRMLWPEAICLCFNLISAEKDNFRDHTLREPPRRRHRPARRRPGRRMNHNVRLALIFSFLNSASRGIWAITVLSGYLYILTNSNFKVGLAEGLQGLTQAVVAIPAGIFLTDRIGRDRALRVAGTVGCLAVSSLILILLVTNGWDESVRYWAFTGGLMSMGAYTGVWSNSLEAIYADSVPEQDKARYLMYKFVLNLAARTLGPVTAIALFQWRGDTWTIPELKAVMIVGLAVGAVSTSCLFFFDDQRSLGRESEAAYGEIAASDADLDNAGIQDDERPGPVQPRSGRNFLCFTTASVPYILSVMDVLMGVASGMTIKFFPLFFRKEVGLSPAQVLIIYTVTYPLMSVFSKTTERLADPEHGRLGRAQTCLLTNYLGVSFLFTMGFARSLWKTWYYIVPIYVVRTALMNATYPLKKSVLMNFVKKSDRGRWNSIDSITSMGWSGSAVIGGILADKYGYGFSFLVTAAIQTTAASFWWLLIPLVPASRTARLSNPSRMDGASAEEQIGGFPRRGNENERAKPIDRDRLMRGGDLKRDEAINA